MLFSKELKEKTTKVFFRENIKNKLTKEEIKNGVKMELSDVVFSQAYLFLNIIFLIFFCLFFNTIKYNIFGQQDYNQLTFFISILIPFITSFYTTKYLLKSKEKSIKTLQKKINKEKIMNTLKLSLKEIINDNKNSIELIAEAKSYISMLAQGQEELLYQKINKEKIFSIKDSMSHSNIIKEYYLCCIEERDNMESKILSSEDITKIKIDKLEAYGFNANHEIDKILERI